MLLLLWLFPIFSTDKGIDGINQWPAINQGTDGERTEFIYNLDDTVPAPQGHAGIRSVVYTFKSCNQWKCEWLKIKQLPCIKPYVLG